MSTDYTWINGFNPKKRLLVGNTYHAFKRWLDLFLVILFMPAWVLLACLIAFAIKVTSPGGEVIFSQQRTGKGGRRFRMYKFRTMVPNAEVLKVKYSHLNELKWPDFKITNDPRITPIGRFLRKTSLDELPQLINVLRGEMSLVGPRPTSWSPQSYQLWHTERLDVLPGITGLWQILGRAQVEFDDRLRLDIAYIERSSLWFDIVILVKTVTAVFKQRGAH
jgi:lipopolysaccharide/colanic/teichoic acid biosynthesis glycosyltransferase